jgi:hypothetical protein
VPLDQGERLFDQRLKLGLKFEEALQLPLTTDREKLRFIRLHAELRLGEQRAALATRRLEQRCAEALRKHKIAAARLELTRRREERRAQEAARRAAERERKQEEKQARIRRRQAKLELQQQEWEAQILLTKQQAARSRLAQLRWQYSADYQARRGRRFTKARIPERATLPRGFSRPMPSSHQPGGARRIDRSAPAVEKERCMA